MAKKQKAKRELRPFHETVLDAIFSGEFDPDVMILDLIQRTKIPKGHDEIIAAIKERWPRSAASDFKDKIEAVKASLLEQKRATEQAQPVEIPSGSR